MKKNLHNRGFTLIEALIYIVLFGMLMGGAVVAAFQLLQSGDKQQSSVVAQQEGTFVNRKLFWAMAPATDVTVSGGNILTIRRPDLGSDDPLVVNASGSRITLKRGSQPALPLTTDGLTITNVSFTVLPPSGGLPKSVHTDFTINGKQFTYGMYLRQ